MLLFGPHCIVALVLAIAGVGKLSNPAPARAALRALGVRAPSSTVRALGAAEVALGVAAVVVGGVVLPLGVAAAYVAFGIVAWRLRGASVGCGCFGAASSAPPGGLHVGVDAVSAAIAAGAAGAGVPGVRAAWADLPAAGVPHVALVVIGVAGVLGILTVLADARFAAGSPARAAQPVLFQSGRRSR
jgi:hypothetical protein